MACDNGVLEQRNFGFILPPEQKVNILLVDEQPENLLNLEAILDGRLGQNLVKANSGKEALRCLLNQDFAVILLDVQMPGMDGFETAKLIRAQKRSRHTPIIFLTAFSTSVSLMFGGYSQGTVDYLFKPISPELLTSKVAVFVDLFKKTAEVKRLAAQLAAVNAELRESKERYTDSHCQAICGFTRKESDKASWLQSVHPEHREQVLADCSTQAFKGQEYFNQLRCLPQKGIVRWAHVQQSLMLFDKGELIDHVGIVENLNSRKHAEVDHKRANEALLMSEARFCTLAETTDAIIFIKQGTQFCYVNPAAEAITGYRREELLAYLDISELIQEHGQSRQQGKLVFPQNEEIKQCKEIKILTKNGEERWLDCCLGVIEFEGELAVLGTAIDITKRKLAEVEIRQALEQEKELSELRARFISIVSHEFRIPLNNISLSTSSLRRYSHQWTESEKLEYLYGIETDIEQLSQLLDEVLIIGGAEAGKQRFEPRPLDVRQFCHDIVAEMQLHDNSQHAFSFVSRGDCSTACVDKKLLQPIVTNLLSNAIKYSPTNSKVKLELSCQEGYVIFQIKDQGIGISAADQQQLFEPFYRGKNIGDIPGTGLGLAVVKRFVDLHGGQIAVASEVGVETTFTVMLPLH